MADMIKKMKRKKKKTNDKGELKEADYITKELLPLSAKHLCHPLFCPQGGW